MRKLGPEPLTGAQKQRRHRDRVKARLAEAEILRAKFQGEAGSLVGLGEFYEAMLREVGATPDESRTLCGDLADLLRDVQDAARQRGEKELAILRARRRKTGASLLARLAAIKPEPAQD